MKKGRRERRVRMRGWKHECDKYVGVYWVLRVYVVRSE